jgi:hypothetical protein
LTSLENQHKLCLRISNLCNTAMPLKSSALLQILEQKSAFFTDYHQSATQIYHEYRSALRIYSRKNNTELTELLLDELHPGARPLEPLGQSIDWKIPAKLKWTNREQSLQWVRDRLQGITTFAVDGSQIFPTKDVMPPIALVQVGWFENPHGEDGEYTKDIRLNVLTPEELEVAHLGRTPERQVGMHRFQMEVERIIEYMETHAGCLDRLVFFDGSLVATFAEVFDWESRQFYAQQCVNLLRASEQYRVPLVGYIDTTHACDLVQLLRTLKGLPESTILHDAILIGSQLQWGDRTPLFLCDRPGDARIEGILSAYEEQQERITFTYLKANDGYPVRLEFPRWIYEAGLLETVLDIVRGEIIIGGGYPYVIETADQVAVLQMADRQLFFQLLQEWADRSDIRVRFSRKMVSKLMRRLR